MTKKIPIAIAYGNGIGPEIMQATLDILTAAHANIDPIIVEMGEKAYLEGFSCGIPDDVWPILKATKVLIKGPITTPQGGGYKSLNVTLRKTLGLYANVRPCFAYYPYVPAKCLKMDLVIIRENEEDTYAGIEHRQTEDVYQCLKLVTRPGCEHIIQYAFEYARKFNRKKVTCLVKDNIMKMTDGLFHRVFDEIAKLYPDIESDHLIVDIGTALIASKPERFDVIVTLNLYGDIISDVAAQIAGSVGLAGSANIGANMAMFEAIHGSAPDIAGKDIANPSGLINAAIQMLVHIDQPDVASLVENAWLKAIEDGMHTADIYSETYSVKKLGTQAFAQEVIARLGQAPIHFKPAHYLHTEEIKTIVQPLQHAPEASKKLVGIDVFIDNTQELPAEQLAELLKTIRTPLDLVVITSRGLKIWPRSSIDDPYLKHCCCRFQTSLNVKTLTAIDYPEILNLLTQLTALGLAVIKTENLYTFDDELGFSLAQGQ